MLQAKIATGEIECGIAMGSDTTSDAPIVFKEKFAHRLVEAQNARSVGQRLAAFKGFSPGELAPQPPNVGEPRTGLSMGQHTELMAQEWKITRAEQDQLAYESHRKAAEAYRSGYMDDLIVPFAGVFRDNNLREDISLEKIATLKPAFDKSERGTLTAANSTPLTDGAAAVLLASEEWAAKRGLPMQAYLTYSQTAANNFVAGEGLLMAPTIAISRMLERAQLKLQDFDFYEIHEAWLGADDPDASPHLRSRRETGERLASAGVPVTTLRAAMIVGKGSAAFETIFGLVKRLPVMVTPSWVSTPSAADRARRRRPIPGRRLRQRGRLRRGLRHGRAGGDDLPADDRADRFPARPDAALVEVPVLTPYLSSLWLNLVTPVNASVARPLIEGLRNPTIAREERIRKLPPLDSRRSTRRRGGRSPEQRGHLARPVVEDPLDQPRAVNSPITPAGTQHTPKKRGRRPRAAPGPGRPYITRTNRDDETTSRTVR